MLSNNWLIRGSSSQIEEFQQRPVPDYLMCADCVYKKDNVPHLLQTMHALSGDNTRILMCFKEYNPESTRVLWSQLEAYFEIEKVNNQAFYGCLLFCFHIFLFSTLFLFFSFLFLFFSLYSSFTFSFFLFVYFFPYWLVGK